MELDTFKYKESFLIHVLEGEPHPHLFSGSELGGQTGLKPRSWWAFYWLRKGHRIKSMSMNSVCDVKEGRAWRLCSFQHRLPWEDGEFYTLKLLIHLHFPGSLDVTWKVPSLYHVQGSESPDDTSTWILTAPPIHARERSFNNLSLLSLPGDLEKSLSHVQLFVTPWSRLLRPWDFPGKITGVGSHSLLQEIFPTQGANPGLLHCRQTLYCLSHQES